MRKVSPLLPLLLILALAGCSSEDLPSDPSPASSASASGESSAVSSEVSISGAPSQTSHITSSSETPPAAPTYADYFAEEYRFDAQPTNPEEPDAYVFLFSEEDEQNGITGFEKGYLYKTRFDDLYNPETTTLFYPEKVAAFARVKEHILACIGNEIIRLNYDGKEEGTMLTADSAITDIRASELLIFYVAGDRMYRFFAPTQTTDLMGEVAGIDSFTVYSNCRLQWRKPNPDWCGDFDCTEHPMSLTYILYANPLDPPPQTYPADQISGGELEEWLFALPTYPGA